MSAKIGKRVNDNYNKPYRLSGKKNKTDPRTISTISTSRLEEMLKDCRKKDRTKLIHELAKRVTSDKKEQKAYITSREFQLVSTGV